MPEIRFIPLEEVLSEAQLTRLDGQLKELGVEDLQLSDEDDIDIDDVLSEDQLTDFMDRLDARDLACTIYLPMEFDGRVEIADQSIGSSHALLDVLEELREELDIDEEEGDADEDELDLEVIEEQLRYAWHVFLKAASTSIDKQIPFHILS